MISDPNDNDELLGFNVMVGGGMGRTHNKENTFARAADHLGVSPPGSIIPRCELYFIPDQQMSTHRSFCTGATVRSQGRRYGGLQGHPRSAA